MSRKLALVAILVLAVGGIAAAVLILRPQAAGEALRLYGNVEVRQVDLAFPVEGRLEQALVEEGDEVAAGQVVARLEQGYFADALRLADARVAARAQQLAKLEAGSRPEEIDEARARVAADRALLAKARQDFSRQSELVERRASPQRAVDDARAALDAARAALEASEARLRLAQIGPRAEDIAAARAELDAEGALRDLAARRLADASLSAPADGIVMTRVREPGAVLAPGTTVYVLAKPDPVWVRAFVPEPDLGRVQPGAAAKVYTDSRPGRPYAGRVGYVAPVAEFTPKTVQTPELRTDLVYRFHVVIDDPDELLRQGMPATVAID